jgi:hypothetical protein
MPSGGANYLPSYQDFLRNISNGRVNVAGLVRGVIRQIPVVGQIVDFAIGLFEALGIRVRGRTQHLTGNEGHSLAVRIAEGVQNEVLIRNFGSSTFAAFGLRYARAFATVYTRRETVNAFTNSGSDWQNQFRDTVLLGVNGDQSGMQRVWGGYAFVHFFTACLAYLFRAVDAERLSDTRYLEEFVTDPAIGIFESVLIASVQDGSMIPLENSPFYREYREGRQTTERAAGSSVGVVAAAALALLFVTRK